MREIKFRAWNYQDKEMIEVENLSFGNDSWDNTAYSSKKKGTHSSFFRYDGNTRLMQFTGFKTNGVEIYEGDILEEDGDWWEVVWDADEGRWICNPILDGNVWSDLSDLVPSQETWVRGNIYENPELLK